MEKRNILLVNDDGIHSPGLVKLAAAAARFGRVWVAAPAAQCSGMSHRLTISDLIPVEQVDFPVPVETAWKIGGTPADCVKIAMYALLPVKPDYVLSGINAGFNAGHDIAYSGTIGAAMESLLDGVPAMAFSNGEGADFTLIDAHLEEILGELLRSPVSLREVWNVNFPNCPPKLCKGIRRGVFVAPQSLFAGSYTPLTRETKGPVPYQPRGKMLPLDGMPPGSDLHEALDGYITIGKVRCAVMDGLNR